VNDFLATWSLFWPSFLAGWVIAALLAVVGVWVVARREIFLGAAVSQASTLGIALALSLGAASGAHWLDGDGMAAALAITAAVATALVSARGGGPGRESAEGIVAWIFLLSASVPTLLLAHSPHGLEEIHRLAFSTLLGAQAEALGVLAALLGATLLAAWRFRDPLLLLALDAETAAALGVPRQRLVVGAAIWLGVCVGFAMRVSGMLYAFGCLVLPALVARRLARESRPLVWLAPVIALAAALPGFVLAHISDVPPAQMTVTLLCAALVAAWSFGRPNDSRDKNGSRENGDENGDVH
jgi:ABC-type Mn2+/Zn2+ transport system permease subunit